MGGIYQKIGSSMMRNSRLLEVLMERSLKIEIDEEMVCYWPLFFQG